MPKSQSELYYEWRPILVEQVEWWGGVRGDEKQLQEKEHEENYHQLLTFLAGKENKQQPI
jgi:hypothetical protein